MSYDKNRCAFVAHIIAYHGVMLVYNLERSNVEMFFPYLLLFVLAVEGCFDWAVSGVQWLGL